jgi:iron(III) transport system substrate-binding protein
VAGRQESTARLSALPSLGTFKADTLNIAALGKNQALAQRIFDRAGYK